MALRAGGRAVIRRHAAELLFLGALLLTAGWLRGQDLDRFIASDELRWTCRSINFHAALAEGRWEDTFQVGHPGVLTMWLGSLALPLDAVGDWRELARDTEGCTDLSALDDLGQEGVLQSAAPLLFQSRRGVAWATTLALGLLYLILRAGCRLRPPPALGGLALVALDPFFLAHSRVLHVDAVMSIAALASVAALAAAARQPGGPAAHTLAGDVAECSAAVPASGWHRAWLAASGALAGLAMLNKASALVLAPFALAWLGWWAWRNRAWREGLIALAAWSLGAGLAFVALWPAMWVDPIGTIRGVLQKAQDEGGEPHASGNFFLGRPVEDPGPLFYPIAGAYRLTPWSLLGLLAALFVVRRPEAIRREDADLEAEGSATGGEERALHLIRLLLLWALVFGLFMTLGPKKFDRYLLPALLAVDLAGGVAMVFLVESWVRRAIRGAWWASTRRIVLAGWFAALGLASWQAHAVSKTMTYPLAYYNPLLGGIQAAHRLLLVGWGEGYDLAADYLNGLPGAESLSASVRGVANFAPLFVGRTRSAPGYEAGRTDYVVVYISQAQRRQNDDLLAAYLDDPALAPVFVGQVAGLDYVWVYPNRSVAPVLEALRARAEPQDVLLLGGETVLARQDPGPWPLLRYWGHWGEAEVEEALDAELPPDWQRLWVLRYPGEDPDAIRAVLDRRARRGETIVLADGAAELTPYTRGAP